MGIFGLRSELDATEASVEDGHCLHPKNPCSFVSIVTPSSQRTVFYVVSVEHRGFSVYVKNIILLPFNC